MQEEKSGMFENSTTEPSPVGSLDQSLTTADTTPIPEDESEVETGDLPENTKSAKKKGTRSRALEKLLADHDWYVTFEPESRRTSSIKRQQHHIEEGMSDSKSQPLEKVRKEMSEEEKARRRQLLHERVLKKQAEKERRKLTLQRKKEERSKMIAAGLVPEMRPKPKTSLNSGMKDLIDGAMWFNRNAELDTYTRKIKPQTDRFIIEEDVTVKRKVKSKADSKKIAEEDSILKARGQNKRSEGVKKKSVQKVVKTEKKVNTKTPKVKKEKQKKQASQAPEPIPEETQEVEEPQLEEEIIEEKFNWFFDIDSTNEAEYVSVGSRQLFLDELYQGQKITTDYSSLPDQSPDKLVSAAELVCHFEKNFYNTEEFPCKEFKLSTLFSNYTEDYILSLPKDSGLNPYIEIGINMELTAMLFLPDKYKLLLKNEDNPEECIVGKYIKAFYEADFVTLCKQLEQYNVLIDDLRETKLEEVAAHLKSVTKVPRIIFHEILNQSYSRTVSPNVRSLRSYKAFSNEVYGELLPSFLSRVYEQTGLRHDKKFIDLGSGVGNCVLQAALEYGCESYGCEIMQNASKLAALQQQEFVKRCKIFGIKPGFTDGFLEQSFVNNDAVTKVVCDSDVILCNNYLFDAALNAKCIEVFRGLKTGTQIITLKPLVPLGYSFNEMDVESILNRIKVEKFSYGNNSVSWTDNGGTYYINHVQQDIVGEYFVERAKGRTSRTRFKSSSPPVL